MQSEFVASQMITKAEFGWADYDKVCILFDSLTP